MIIKASLIWLLIGLGEVLNGNLRVRYLQRKFGRRRAKDLSLAIGVAIFYLIAWFSLPWIAPASIGDCLLIGLLWVVLMTLLDLYFGRFVFRFAWSRIWADFDPRKGNWLGIGMILLFLCPSVIFLLK